MEPSEPKASVDSSSSLILSFEEFWVAHQPFIFTRGYQLRDRYNPVWKPSWKKLEGQMKKPIDKTFCEDFLRVTWTPLMDAVRISDGTKVVLKRVKTSREELAIGQYLSSFSDPRNSCVPILDVMTLPRTDDEAVIVMPLLYDFEYLPFRRLGEVTEAFHQFLQGLEFMHEHNIVHRDACYYNLMMDPSKVIPDGFHFSDVLTRDGFKRIEWRERWSVEPVKYYFVDFGLSRRYPAGVTDIVDYGRFGQDRSVPEMSTTNPYDPFKADVYQLGNVFKRLIEKYDGLEPIQFLCNTMTQPDPSGRPSAAEALGILENLLASLRKPDFRRRVWRKKTDFYIRFQIKYFNTSFIV